MFQDGRGFVHLDVQSAYSVGGSSPSLPEDYVRALTRQDQTQRAAIALADYGLHSAIKMAVACARAGIEHIPGLRLRLVQERAFRPWAERPGEVIVLAMDDLGWVNLVQLANLGFLAGGDRGRPRVDWRDLADHAEGLICLAGGPPDAGLLAPYLERAAETQPAQAEAIARKLNELFPDRLYLSLAFHGSPAEKLVNRGLLSLAEKLDLPVVATNAVRFATPEDALAHSVLGAIRGGKRLAGVMIQPAHGGELPTLDPGTGRSQAYLKRPAAMWKLFAQMPAALEATLEIARRCQFRIPLAENTPPEDRYGPARLLGLQPAREIAAQQLADAVDDALPRRLADSGRGPQTSEVRQRAERELKAICEIGLAELLLVAWHVAAQCRANTIPLAARGSATSSLIAWALGLVELCPLDHALQGEIFVHAGRSDLPDLDLEVAPAYEPTVAGLVQQCAAELWGSQVPRDRHNLPAVHALRLGTNISLGARQAVRSVGVALGLEGPRVNALARLVPLLSSPGSIDQVMRHAPELGVGDLSTNTEPYTTILSVAARLEGLPNRHGAHPSAYTFAFFAPSALDGLPAHWVGTDHPGRQRGFGAAKHLALLAQDQEQPASLAHMGGVAPDQQPPSDLDGPVLACQWDKADLELLGLPRLDVSPSPALGASGVAAGYGPPDPDTRAAAWRLLEAGDTLCIPQVETLGMRLLLRRARELHQAHAASGHALDNLEDLAQLLALWRPGAYSQAREDAYFAARFGRSRPAYPHPSVASVLDPTYGHLLYVDQLIALLEVLGFSHAWADTFRRALGTARLAEQRSAMERELRKQAGRSGWSPDQINALLGLIYEHVGYLYNHGHALAMAHRVFQQACLKVNPTTVAAFFAEVLNGGGSPRYGLGAAVEEARRFGVVLLPPCVQRSGDRFLVDDIPAEAHQAAGAVRVPLTAIRGLSLRAAQHVLAARSAFDGFDNLIDFCRKVDPAVVTRQDLLLLIKLGAFSFTGLSRPQLALAERYYASAADLLRAADRNPSAASPVEDDLACGSARYLDVEDWPPEVTAAYELAHLGFYTSAPLEVQKHARRLAEEFGVTSIAELVDYPDKAPVSLAGIVTALRLRTTRKGQPMAWLTLSDGTGGLECAVFPAAFEKLDGSSILREGAFLVARGRLAHEEATGHKAFVEEVIPLGGSGTRLSALAVAMDARRSDEAA
jgi:DNA polymerase-3 subunit alpha